MSHAIARRFIALATVAVLWITATAPAHAAMIGTDRILTRAHLQTYEHVREFHAALARSNIRAELERLGVHPDAIRSRIERLTHRELAYLNGRIARLPVGGDEGFLPLILVAVGIALFVLLIAVIVVGAIIFGLVKAIAGSSDDEGSAQGAPPNEVDCPVGWRQECRIEEQGGDDIESGTEPSSYAMECPFGRGPGC